jgi:hypothetical protein
MEISLVQIEKYFVFIIFAVVALIIGVAFYIRYIIEKKRTEAMRIFAKRRGFSFEQKGAFDKLILFTILKKGHSHVYKNIMKGNVGRYSCTICDFRYTIGYGKNSQTYNQTTVLFPLNNPKINDFTIGPENFFNKIGDMFGFKDIDFIEYPSFSNKYLLKGDNEKEIRTMFTPDVIKYFERLTNRPSIEIREGKLIYFFSGKKIKIDDLPRFLEDASRIVALFDKNQKF